MTEPQSSVSSPLEWAAWAGGEIAALPSNGLSVRLVPVDVIDMMLSDGTVYDMFASMQAQGQTIDEDTFEELAREYPKLKPFLAQITLAAIGEPVVVRENADLAAGQINLKWVLTIDRLFIFRKVFGEAQALAALFPDEQNGDVPPTSNSEAIRAAAQQLGGVIGED